MSKQKIIFQIAAAIILCVAIESLSYLILRIKNIPTEFLVNFKDGNPAKKMKGYGFNEIDPLCGWAMSNEHLKNLGYEVKQNCVVLRSHADSPVQPIKIFITGGSTSDIALHKENWPTKLHEIFLEKKVNAIIYVGAVGGYSSGQELLKLIRDGIVLNPDIHISYSGANDGGIKGYVSEYEKDFYETALQQTPASAILPSTVFLLKKIMHRNDSDLAIKKTEPIKAFNFWKQNMEAMKGIDENNKCQFIGILQPVLGVGKYRYKEQEADYPYRVPLYKEYFPEAQNYIRDEDTTIQDLTNIFDTDTAKVFIDDCHIFEPYQKLVADRIYKLLLLTSSGFKNN